MLPIGLYLLLSLGVVVIGFLAGREMRKIALVELQGHTEERVRFFMMNRTWFRRKDLLRQVQRNEEDIQNVLNKMEGRREIQEEGSREGFYRILKPIQPGQGP